MIPESVVRPIVICRRNMFNETSFSARGVHARCRAAGQPETRTQPFGELLKTTKLCESTKALAMCLSAKVLPQKAECCETLTQRMKHETSKAVRFEIAAAPASRVTVVGSFNRWDPTSHPLTYHPEDGLFRLTLHLPAGTYKYKFLVDGVWQMDATCPRWAMNSHGDLSCVMRV